nr:Type III pantothenate kinase [Cupriavidus sp.]
MLRLAGQCFPGDRHALQAQSQAALVLGGDRVRVDCQYRQPLSLGADRWAAVLGLAAQGRRLRALLAPGRAPSKGGQGGWQDSSGDAGGLVPIWLVSAGTATVVDMVWARADDAGGIGQLSHQGGLILPGIGLMRAALSAATGALGPYVQASAQAGLFKGVPRQSHQAIARGIAAAQVGALLVLPRPSAVFMHGGYARDWRRCFKLVWSAMPAPHKVAPQVFEAPELILDGLAQWAKTLSAR